MPDLSKRSAEIEIMDDLNATGETIDQALRELETINFLLGGNYVTINALDKLLKNQSSTETIAIADLGCGSGDILRLIKKWALKNKRPVQLTGIDANPSCVAFAKAHTPSSNNIQFEAIDIFSSEFQQRKYDVIIGTLFFHHFTNDQLVQFFASLKKNVRLGIIINDIHRHWFAYHSIKWLTQIFSKSDMVKNDAAVSVMRAFKKSELLSILKQAGFQRFSIRWMWAFRWQVIVYLN